VPTVRNAICGITFGIFATGFVTIATAQEVKHYRFAYDQPKTTGYGIAGDLFANKLKELSNGSILIDQYPGAQLLVGKRGYAFPASRCDVASLSVSVGRPLGESAVQSKGK